jgi:hypothetical protein
LAHINGLRAGPKPGLVAASGGENGGNCQQDGDYNLGDRLNSGLGLGI